MSDNKPSSWDQEKDRLKECPDFYSLNHPCHDCPFLKSTPAYLTYYTLRRLERGVSRNHEMHICHHTHLKENPDQRACIGAVLFTRKVRGWNTRYTYAEHKGLINYKRWRGWGVKVWESGRKMSEHNIGVI